MLPGPSGAGMFHSDFSNSPGNGPGAWSLWLAFVLGCLALPLMPVLLPAQWLAPALLLLFAPFRVRSLQLVAAGVLGLAWTSFHADRTLDDQWPDPRAGEVVTVTGTVSGLVETRDRRARFMLHTDDGQDKDIPGRIRVDWHWFTGMPRSGEAWSFELRMQPPGSRRNPGGFDSSRWFLSERIGAAATVAGEAGRLKSAKRRSVADFRLALSEWLQAETTRLEPAALHRALSVADRSAIPRELSETLRRTGTAHLLAISGLHVGMVFASAAFALRWLLAPLGFLPGAPVPGRLSLAGGLIAAAAYALLAGFTLPTRRALVMLFVAVAGLLCRRAIRPGQALLAALVAVLVLDPLAPLSTGFWLSFGAVAVLVWGFAWRPGREGALRGLLRAQLLVAAGLLALNVAVFGQLVPGAFLANLVAIPLVAFWVLPCLLFSIALALAGFHEWAGLPLGFSDQGLVFLMEFIRTVEGLPGGWFAMPTAQGIIVALAFVGGLWLVAPRGVPGRALAPLLMLPLLIPGTTELDKGEFDVMVLDVGHGQSVLVKTASQTWLIGTGPGDGEGQDLVASTIEPVFRSAGRRELDLLIASPERRGYAGGLPGVVETWDPPRILAWPGYPGAAEPCVRGKTHRANGVDLEVLHPAPALPDLGDNSGCVVRVAGKAGSILIAGSVDDAVEARLANHGPSPDARVLVAGRHGHEESSTRSFIQAVNPGKVIFSAGAGNRFELPREETLKRLNALEIPHAGTNHCGAVTVTFRKDRMPATGSVRGASHRFWDRAAASSCP